MRCPYSTASRIKSYKNCEFKYALEYAVMYPPMRAGNIYAEKGSAVHVALEKWANAKLGLEENADEDYEKVLREYYAEHRVWKLDNREGTYKDGSPKGHPHPVQKSCESCPWATKDSKCLVVNKLIDAVEGCPRPNFAEDLELVKKTLTRKDYNPLRLTKGEDGAKRFEKKILGVEYPFDMELEGVPVKGVIDLVFEYDEETLEICDYKTGRAMSYNKAFLDPQVRIYGAVARKIAKEAFGKDYKHIMVTLHYLKTRPVTIPLSAEDDELTFKSLKKNYEEILENDSPRRMKNFLCNYCIGYEACGRLYDNLRVDGKLRLPIISCKYAGGDEPCWGRIYPEKTQEINETNVSGMVYVCKGHAECFAGGEYIPEKTDSD